MLTLRSKSRGALLLPGLLFGVGALCSCPSDPPAETVEAIAPPSVTIDKAGGPAASTENSVLDDVEVMGADEAAQQAEEEIDESNVMDVLDELEKEIDG